MLKRNASKKDHILSRPNWARKVRELKRKQRWETEKGFIVVGSIVVESVVVGSVVIETIFVGSVVVESVVRGGLEVHMHPKSWHCQNCVDPSPHP